MRIILIFLIVLGLPSLAAAGTQDGVTTFRLDNGMDIVVIEDHRAPVVTHMVWYRVGAADEPPGKSGIAHFLEHLLFKGTDDLAPGDFQRIIEANGGNDNAFTSYDYTAYFQRIAADRLGLMMELEADRMRDLVLSEADVLTERQVVLEERNSRVENNPAAIFGEQRTAALYLNHPYGIPIIGWRHEMLGLTLDDALSFYRTYYAPNNAILIVAGDVRPDQVLALAQEHYGPLAPSDLPPRVRPQEPPQLAERRLSFRDPRITQPYVIRTYLAPQRKAGDQNTAAALSILADLLGGGVTSHLLQSLHFDQKVALDAGAFYSATGLGPRAFGVYAIPADGVTVEQAEADLDAAIAAFVPDAAALERVKTNIIAAQVYSLDNQASRARRYGVALTSGLTVEDVQSWPDVLRSVTLEDVQAAADVVFDRRRSVTGYLLGEDEVTQ